MGNPESNLLPRLIGWSLAHQIILAVLLFVPGTLHFWQGWAFMAVNFAVTLVFCLYFYQHDRAALARRMLRKEKIGSQKIILFLIKEVSVIFYVTSGLDHRYGWSQTYLLPVPWWLTTLGLLGYAAGYAAFIKVLNANRFAASIIQVEAGQTIADTGPYRLVRHPMYAAGAIIWLWLPLALGSFVALPVALMMIPILLWRLLNEETFLKRELPGYVEYCQRTPYRLIPLVW